MKCPKCGYISFDYNLSCPKCNKDISSEQEKLHIPAFRPDPPFLLTSLTGEVQESQSGASDSSQIPSEREEDVSLDDSGAIESGEIALEDSSELNLDSGEISLDDTSSLSLDTGEVQPGITRGLQSLEAIKGKQGTGEFKLETEADLKDFELGEEGEEALSIDLPEKPAEPISKKEATDSEFDIELDLDEEDLSIPELSEDSLKTADLKVSSPKHEPLKPAGGETQEKEEIELSLDDLEINDTGELELGSDFSVSGDLDKLLEMDEIKLEESPLTKAPPEAKQEGRVINATATKKKGVEKTGDEEFSLDLEDMELELEMEEAKQD